MIFSYARVSSKDQNIERQKNAISEYALTKNITIDRNFEEKASGKDFQREIYQGMKLMLRQGDTLIIKELDRLGRNMEQIKEEWRDIQKMGVDIIVIDNELLNTSEKTDIERNLISNIVFELLSYMAQKERDRIRARQAEGILIAKTNHKYKGRRPIKCDEFESVYKRWKNGEITAVRAMEIVNLKKATFYRRVKEYEQGIKI